MGQNTSDVTVSLGTFDNVNVGEDQSKLTRILKELSDTSDSTNIVLRWEQKIIKRTKTPLIRWGLGTFAVKTFEKWGRISLMLACSIHLIELARELKITVADCQSSDLECLSENVILADSYLNLTR